MKTLDVSFYLRDAETVARELLGKILYLESAAAPPVSAMIVETEAYTQDDPASHSFRGPTPRSSIMFGEAGTAYVYRIYGIYDCLNAVTGPVGTGEAVLIRAAQPIEGIECIRDRRFPGMPVDPAGTHLLLSGPGNLCRGMGITRDIFNGTSLVTGSLTIREPEREIRHVITMGNRIGITSGKELQRRFFITGHECVSGKRPGQKNLK